MTRGDQVLVAGYDIVARASYADPESIGEAIVLNNNSSHFLVAVRMGDADDYATVEDWFIYGDKPGSIELATRLAYIHALDAMAQIARSR